MAGNHTLGTIRGTIEIDYDGAGIIKANRDTEKAKTNSEGLSKAVDNVGKVYSAAAKRAAVMAATSLLVAGGMNGIAAAISAVVALAPIAYAGLAALPGVVLAIGAGLAVFKAATAGVGDALSAATGDAKQFEEAIKGLAPEAQVFARAWRGALQVLKPMQQAIQNAFFSGLGPEVTRIARGVSSLRDAAVGVAQQFNLLAREAAGAVKDMQFEAIETILGGVKDFLREINGSIKPVIQGFISLAAQASEFGGALGEKVGTALFRLGNFMKNFDLAAAFEKAQVIIQAVSGFLRDLWSIAQSVFGVFNVDGAGALGVIGELVSKLAEFLKTAEGQAALTAIGTAMQAISGAAGQVFLALLQALAPALIALAPGVGQLATQLAGALVPAINALAPILAALAGFLSENMSWVGPLIIGVGALVVAYRAYQAGAKGVAAIQTLLNSRIATALANWARLTAAVVVNTARMAANAAVVGGKAVAAWVQNAAAMAASLARAVALNVVIGVQMAAAWVRNTASVIANTVALAAARIAMVAGTVATAAATAATWLFGAALAFVTSPIGIVIIAIGLLVAAVIWLWKNNETFREIVLKVWAAVQKGISTVIGWFTGTGLPIIKSFINLVIQYFTFMKDTLVRVFNLWWSAVKTVFNGVKTTITTIATGITSYIKWWVGNFLAVVNGISALIGKFQSWFGSIVNAIKAKFTEAVNLAKGLPGRVLSALGNLGSKLYNAGKSLVQGFINGIRDMIGAAGNAARAVVNKVTGFFPGSPAKEGPLSGKGYILLRARRMMEDMATGIDKGAQLPVQATASAVGGVGSSLDGLNAARAVRPATAPTQTFTTPGGRTVTIANLNMRGVWDFTNPAAARGVVATLHAELDKYEKEHA